MCIRDRNRAILKTAAEAAKASSLYVGVAGPKINVTMPNSTVAQKANIEFSNEIQKSSKPSAVIGANAVSYTHLDVYKRQVEIEILL